MQRHAPGGSRYAARGSAEHGVPLIGLPGHASIGRGSPPDVLGGAPDPGPNDSRAWLRSTPLPRPPPSESSSLPFDPPISPAVRFF